MRRILPAVIAASTLLAAVPAAGAPGGGSGGLNDLAGHWARANVEAGVAAGYINGFPDGSFRPDQPATRAEFFKLLTTALRQETHPREFSGFQNEEHWAFQQGYIQGAERAALLFPPDYGPWGADFGPDVPVTRREIVLATVRALGNKVLVNEKDPVLNTPDAGSYAAWLRGWAAVAMSDGVMTGYTDGSLRLEQSATRAEALVMVQRVLAKVTANVAPAAAAPASATARRYPADGEPQWYQTEPWATSVTNVAETFKLPDGARGVAIIPAPGNACYVGYTVDGATPDIMFDVIARLEGGKVTNVFREQFAGRFRNIVAVDPRGRVWFTDGPTLQVATADGQIRQVEGVNDRLYWGVWDPQGNLLAIGEQGSSKQIYRISQELTTTILPTGLKPPGQQIQHIHAAADGSLWLLVYDGHTDETHELQLAGGQIARDVVLINRYVAGPDAMPSRPLGSDGRYLWLARETRTGPATWAVSGYFRVDLATGAFRPVVPPQSIKAPYALVTEPGGAGALIKDADGKFWRILP